MKISPETIKPKIYVAEFGDGWRFLLADDGRVFRDGRTTEPGTGRPMGQWDEQEGWDKVLFPVMIEIPLKNKERVRAGSPIYLGVDGMNKNWTMLPPSQLGISEHSAKAALADAWFGVKDARLDMGTMLPHLELSLNPLVEHNDGTKLWMINSWMWWDDWNRRGLNNPARVKELAKMGLRTDAKALRNAAYERGMAKMLIE